jgi:hypothetical protein
VDVQVKLGIFFKAFVKQITTVPKSHILGKRDLTHQTTRRLFLFLIFGNNVILKANAKNYLGICFLRRRGEIYYTSTSPRWRGSSVLPRGWMEQPQRKYRRHSKNPLKVRKAHLKPLTEVSVHIFVYSICNDVTVGKHAIHINSLFYSSVADPDPVCFWAS